MSLSPTAISEIRSELSSLQELKARIDARVSLLEAVLVPLDLGQAALPFQPSGNDHQTGRQIRVREVNDPSFVSTGLRAAILNVLKERGPSRAPDVAKVLADKGFSNDSSTALPIRVYNDLWRLGQKGTINNKNGMFSLKD